jgi:hypothetical protein
MANRCDWCKEIIKEGTSFGNRNVTASFKKGHRLRKKIRNYEYENDRQRD